MRHMRALPHREVASALRKLRTSDAKPVALLAFEFLVLTAARWGEAALAQVVKNKVEAAYRRTDLFERRRRLMEDGAGYPAGGSPATGGRPAPLIRRGGPPGRLRNLAFEPAAGRSIVTAGKCGSVPIGECT